MSTESSVPLSYLEALGSFSILQAFMVNWLQVGLVMQVLLITVPLVPDLHRSAQYKYPVRIIQVRQGNNSRAVHGLRRRLELRRMSSGEKELLRTDFKAENKSSNQLKACTTLELYS